MYVSLNWLRDFVDVPADVEPRALAERFTLTTAEVEDVFAVHPGDRTPAETAAVEEDWIIEIDNKSITHRPDLWGHYGIARELAAMLDRPLLPMAVADGEQLDDEGLAEIPIEIDDARACPRYSALMIEGVRSIRSPSWMQSRLANVGIRPIDALVDLTNYVMAELGQPMHAFDGTKVQKIEVAVSKGGETFVTLDGINRTLPAGTVMIQSGRKNVAIAGIMGGRQTEVTNETRSILLESANFDAASIRRAATAMGHRTEAGTRFEKSLDPAWTVLGLARFVHLARSIFPEMKLTHRLSDCFPNPPEPRKINIDPSFVRSVLGQNVSFSRMKDILEAIEFKVEDAEDHIEVFVPSFRATKDIEGEADIIEEIARFVGYDRFEPVLPQATVRHFEPNPIHRLEKRTLQVLCGAAGYHEIQDYIWYPENWLKTLDYEPGPSICVRNPAATGLERLRKSVIPSLLQAAELNRRTYPDLKLLTIGTVFPNTVAVQDPLQIQERHLGLLSMVRRKKADEELWSETKSALSRWARELFDVELQFTVAEPIGVPWESSQIAAELVINDRRNGRMSSVPMELRRRVNEHFTAWSVVTAEVNLSMVEDLRTPERKLQAIPEFPVVELDFSVLVSAAGRFETLRKQIGTFGHPLLRRLTLEDVYSGKNLPDGQRSLLLRAQIGHPERTLGDEDIKNFSDSFGQFLHDLGLELRR